MNWFQHSSTVLTAVKAYNKIVVAIEFKKSSGNAIIDDVSVTAAAP